MDHHEFISFGLIFISLRMKLEYTESISQLRILVPLGESSDRLKRAEPQQKKIRHNRKDED